MRTIATVFCYIGIGINIVCGLAFLLTGYIDPRAQITGDYVNGTHYVKPLWMWIVFLIWIILQGIIMFCRDFSLDHNKKIGVGIATLILVSLIGGIITLCIPTNELEHQFDSGQQNFQPPTITAHVEEKEPDSTEILSLRLGRIEKMYRDGRLTQSEYEELKKKTIEQFKY